MGRYFLYRNPCPAVVSIRKPRGQDPRGGITGSPSWRSATCLAADVVPAGRRGGAGLARPAASTLDCRHRRAVGTAMAGASSVAGRAGRLHPRTLPEPSCLALAPLVAATGVASGVPAVQLLDYDSDAIRLRNPTRSRRLTGRRVCVGDHLRPVTGGTYDSRGRRLGSPQSSPEVPAATQEGPAGTGRGLGDTAEDRCSGGPETSGVVAGNRGVRSGRWRCRSGTRSPTACDPSASLPRPAPSLPERAWPFAVGWRVLLARSRRPVLPDLGTARRSTPSRRTRRAG